jgi:hypothetical protein
MQIDFVKTPYTTGPNMIRNTGPVFISSPDLNIIKKKKEELAKYNTDLFGQIAGSESTVESAARYCGVYSNQIQDLALRLEEDVAVMHQGKLTAICFCFPSGFIPSQRLGMALEDIHRPVADSELLVKASPGISRVMCEQASFRRWVWTITTSSNLSNHPHYKKEIEPVDLDDLYFRYETQTTAKIDSETSLFFVKMDVVPLKSVYHKRILDSVNSMTDNILEYKNLTKIKKLLNLLDIENK